MHSPGTSSTTLCGHVWTGFPNVCETTNAFLLRAMTTEKGNCRRCVRALRQYTTESRALVKVNYIREELGWKRL